MTGDYTNLLDGARVAVGQKGNQGEGGLMKTALEIATAALLKLRDGTCDCPDGDLIRHNARECDINIIDQALAAMRAAPGLAEDGPLLDAIQATIAYLRLPAESVPGADEGMGNMLENELERYQREKAGLK
jgi:hypothetical protein